MLPGRVLIAASLSLVVCTPTPSRSQDVTPPPDTRAEALRRAREARPLTTYQPNPLERSMALVENHLMPLLVRDGLHWKLGSLTTGSGFAYGGGFRNRRLFNREEAFTVWAAASLKKYTAVESRLDFPDLLQGRVFAGAYARHHSYPQQAFFGLGPSSRRADLSAFHLRNTMAGAQGGVRPWTAVTIGGGIEWSRPRIEPGQAATAPSVDERFDDSTAPGLQGAPDFVRTSGFVDVDYRRPKNARRGGWYRVDLSQYSDRAGAFDFRRIDVDLRQYASVLAERRVFAFRLYTSTSDGTDGGRVPFYVMPSLGGHDSLRGYRDYRFRGPHAILAQAEYRWEVWSGLDAALFYDAGKVADRRGDLNFHDLNRAYGFGFRFNTDQGVIMRVDAGFGSRDGKHLYIVFGDVF